MKILSFGIIGTLMVLMAACTADEGESSVNTPRPIAFTSYTAQPVTRADSAMMP